jgi:hypothetical protein
MTLLPIIYTSVLIFSAFMFFVIVLSYIIFKAKSKDRVPVYLKHFDPLGNRLAAQPLLMNINQPSVTIPLQKKVIHLNQTGIKNRRDDYNQAVQVMQKEKFSRQRSEQVPQYENSLRRTNYRAKPISTRIEVMNHSEKFRTNDEENKKMTATNRYTNHSDINLLAFYSDISDLDFVSLSAPRANKAI